MYGVVSTLEFDVIRRADVEINNSGGGLANAVQRRSPYRILICDRRCSQNLSECTSILHCLYSFYLICRYSDTSITGFRLNFNTQTGFENPIPLVFFYCYSQYGSISMFSNEVCTIFPPVQKPFADCHFNYVRSVRLCGRWCSGVTKCANNCVSAGPGLGHDRKCIYVGTCTIYYVDMLTIDMVGFCSTFRTSIG